MKNWKIWKIAAFITMCICLNIGGKLFSVWLELPLWLDSLGTALAAYIAGPVCGAMVGFTGNMAYSVVNNFSAAYSITNIALGIMSMVTSGGSSSLSIVTASAMPFFTW